MAREGDHGELFVLFIFSFSLTMLREGGGFVVVSDNCRRVNSLFFFGGFFLGDDHFIAWEKRKQQSVFQVYVLTEGSNFKSWSSSVNFSPDAQARTRRVIFVARWRCDPVDIGMQVKSKPILNEQVVQPPPR